MINENLLELLCAAINDCDNAKMTQTSETLRILLSELEALNKPNPSISRFAYDLYKQDWIDTHTNSKMRLDAVRNYRGYVLECIKEGFEIDSFEEWIEEVGYGGSIYVCYEEFCDAEYHDKDYICRLLRLLGSIDLIALYYNDINNDNEF